MEYAPLHIVFYMWCTSVIFTVLYLPPSSLHVFTEKNKIKIYFPSLFIFDSDITLFFVSMPTFFMINIKSSKVSESRWKIVHQKFSTLFARLSEQISICTEPLDETLQCEIWKSWREKMHHREMSVILNLSENLISWFDPVIVDIVESFVESFHDNPFNRQSTKNNGSFEDLPKVDLKWE